MAPHAWLTVTCKLTNPPPTPPAGAEAVALPMVPTRLRTRAKSGVPLVRQPSQATSQDARDLNHQLEALKQMDAKRSADHQMLEKLVDEQQDDLRRLSDLRVFLQDHASGAAPFDYILSTSVHRVVESLPTQLREWILGPELAREGEVALSTSVIQARIRGLSSRTRSDRRRQTPPRPGFFASLRRRLSASKRRS